MGRSANSAAGRETFLYFSLEFCCAASIADMVIDKLKTNDSLNTVSSTYWTNYYNITDTLQAGVVIIDRLYIDSMTELKKDLVNICCAEGEELLVSCKKEEIYITGVRQEMYHLIVRKVTKPYTSIVYNSPDYVKKNDWTITCCNVPLDVQSVNNAVVEKTTRVMM